MATTTPASTLLSQSLEALQSVEIDGNQVVISALDSLAIGAQTTFGADYTQVPTLWLFAEDVVLSDSFAMRDGVISAHTLAVAGAPGRFDVSGATGTSNPAPNMNPSAPGTAGGPGERGGELSLYVESVSSNVPDFTIDAAGGNGGPGQPGTASTPGATGGDGGTGGHVVAVAGIPPLDWLGQLVQIEALSTLAAKQAAVTNVISRVPSDAWAAAARRSLQTAAAASSQDDFEAALATAARQLQLLSTGFTSTLTAVVDVNGGRYGVYGEGKPNGSDGSDGEPGWLKSVTVGSAPEVATATFPPFFVVHPSQCGRMLEKARLMYLVLDPVRNPDGVSDLMSLLLRLQLRTGMFTAAADDSPLVAYYAANEAKLGAVGAVAQLRAMNDEVTRYLGQLKQGRDLYGNSSQTVPLASFGFYKALLDELVTNFSQTERTYEAYFTALAADSAQLDSVKAARDQQSAVMQTAQTQLTSLKALATKTAAIIDGYQVTLPVLKQALEDAMQAAASEIADTFHFDFDAVVQGLSTVAFAPESEVMILTQAGSFLYNGTTKVTNDQGVPVRTSYLVSQIKAVQGDVDSISEGYQQLDDGTLSPDDPGAGKLVADEQQIMALLDQIRSQFPDALAALKTAFDNYIAQIQERNNQILTYNATVLLMLRNAQLIADGEATIKTLNDQALAAMPADLPDLVSFVSGVYYAARRQVMETLDLTARAFRFWALSDEDLLATAYGGRTPPAINSTALIAAQDAILDSYRQAVESFGTNASVFPRSDRAKGLTVTMPAVALTLLKSLHQAMVRLGVVTPATSRAQSVFAGMANVRVLLARVWVHGAQTSDNQLRVTITHTGAEQIASPSGDVFSFSHDPVTKLFSYDLKTGEVIEEANFGVAQSGVGSSSGETYAALGPFTTWQVKVDPALNSNLDLSKVTDVQIEFHGTNLAFA